VSIVREHIFYWCLALGGLVLVVLLQVFDPVNYARFTAEDWVFEYAGAVAFLLAGALMWLSLGKAPGKLYCALVLGMGAAFFFAGFEEISWGQRILGFSTPELLLGINAQREFTIHNLALLPRINKNAAIAHCVLCWIGAAWLAVLIAPHWVERWRRRGVPILPMALAPLFLLFCFFILVKTPVIKRDEVGECTLGVAAAIFALHWLLLQSGGHISLRKRALWILALLLLIAAGSGILTWRFRGDPWGRLNAAAVYDYPRLGWHSQSLEVFEYLEAHPQLRSFETHLTYVVVLQELGRAAEARRTLADAAAFLKALGPRDDYSRYLRRWAGIYKLQAQPEEAAQALEEALRLDRERWEHADSPEAKTEALWSEVRTLFAQGKQEEALTAFARVQASASPWLRFRTKRWLQRRSELTGEAG